MAGIGRGLIWVLSWPLRRLQRRRRAQEIQTVASAHYRTNFVDDTGKDTGLTGYHQVFFHVDGNGLRFTTVDSTHPYSVNVHPYVRFWRKRWSMFGQLPEDAEHYDQNGPPVPPPPAPRSKKNFRIIPGGRS